ncbi:DNA-binding protein [Aeromonas caviae]|uniref:helix-turn-helix domain-containing transcriptional regulator n=1 Tax=Aeromonas sp. 1HA1 TaxID=2699193 RepID=UPI0023DD8DB3|nr:hypothetical protein [Aeromonas sp. 1HA1]
MEEEFSKYDPTEYLTNEAEINAYLDEAIRIGESDLISAVLDDILKAKNMKKTSPSEKK